MPYQKEVDPERELPNAAEKKTMFCGKKYCMLRWFMSRLMQWSGSDWRSPLINYEES